MPACSSFRSTAAGFNVKLSSAGLVYRHFGKEIVAKELGLPQDHPTVHTLWLKVYEQFMLGALAPLLLHSRDNVRLAALNLMSKRYIMIDLSRPHCLHTTRLTPQPSTRSTTG